MNETNRAVAALRATLPETWRHTPRLVQTDSEAIDGIAFCPKPHATEGEDEFAACEWCEVIDTYSPQLAARIVALLRATEPLAAHLNALDIRGHALVDTGDGWKCAACGDLGRRRDECPGQSAARIVEAINEAVSR